MRVVLHVQSELDRGLVERVRGQLSDLPVVLIEVDAPAPDQELAARARHVERLAVVHGADVALWFASPAQADTRLLVFVSAVGHDPVLVRRLDAEGGAPSSGLLEAAALVVRSSLSALVDGEALGVSLRADERGQPSRASVQAVRVDTLRRTAAPVRSAEATPNERAPVVLGLLAGWHGIADGGGPTGQHGVLVRASFAYGLLELAAALGAGLAVTRQDALAELSLARHSATVSLGVRLEQRALRFSGGAHAGVALFQRSTSTRSTQLAAHSARFTAAGLLGPWLGFAYMPGPLGIGVQLALDVLPGPPRFVYDEPEGQRLVHRPWALQPRAAIGLAGELR